MDPQKLSELIDRLGSASIEDQEEAIKSLGQIGADAKAAIPRLLDLLSEEHLQIFVIVALRRIGVGSPEVITAFVQFIQKPTGDELRRIEAAKALATLDDGTVQKSVTECLSRSEATTTRKSAVLALSLLAARGQNGAINAVIEAFHDRSHEVREAAIVAFDERIGVSAIPCLRQCMSSPDIDVRICGADAFQRITGNRFTGEVAESVLGCLSNTTPVTLCRALKVLSRVERLPSSASEQLLNYLSEEDADVRYWAVESLSRIDPLDTKVLKKLIDLLRDSSASVRGGAADAIGKNGARAKSAVPRLIDCLEDADPWVRILVASALGSIGSDALEAVPTLLRLTREDEDNEVRVAASMAVDVIKE